MNPASRVWEWVWPDGRRAALWGIGHEPWRTYSALPGSQLAEAMSEGGYELDWSLVPTTVFTKTGAAQTARLIRHLRRDQGCTVLMGRQYRGSKPVVAVEINGRQFRSLRSAARELGTGRFRLWWLHRLGRLDELGDAANLA